MIVSAIVAASRNKVIGVGDEIPWHLPKDFAHFKKTTMGKVLIMGRKTFESIGMVLPGRVTVVLTENANYGDALPEWAKDKIVDDLGNGIKGRFLWDHTLDDALHTASFLCEEMRDSEVMVCGGEAIYKLANGHIERLYYTEVDTEIIGNEDEFVYFPGIPDGFKIISKEVYPSDDKHQYGFAISVWER